MNYKNVIPAVFLSRPNRFIAQVSVNGTEETVHVKNTGRCKELLVPGAGVYLSVAENLQRKTAYDLIAVEKQREGKSPLLINMDSQVVNDVTEEWLRTGQLFSPDAVLRREVFYGRSRFDFYVQDRSRKAFLEVKGVTLERDGVASFPDAPTERGVKHLRELAAARKEGYEAYVLFIIQMKEVHVFQPNDGMHKGFGDALRDAFEAGVGVLALDCVVSDHSIVADKKILVRLEE